MQGHSSAFRAPHVLFRVKQDGSSEQVSKHPSFEEGWQAGQRVVHENKQDAYSLYRGDRRVARFGHSRLHPRAQSIDWSVLS